MDHAASSIALDDPWAADVGDLIAEADASMRWQHPAESNHLSDVETAGVNDHF
jgi:hypothetical protein